MNNPPRFQAQPRGPVDSSEPVQVVALPPDRPSVLTNARRAASELHDRIELWVNEGGAGGEDDESAPRTRNGG